MRDSQLLKIRPELNLSNQNATTLEVFQNQTLRPILKLQHQITLLALLQSNQFSKIKDKLDLDDTNQLRLSLTQYISSDRPFRSRLIGCIIGMMTLDELTFYFKYESEFNKRIITMQKERFADALSSYL